ncbi:MAG TPA: HAMP domain-containing sensor histidine kinase [Caulobacteraceae bacterium]
MTSASPPAATPPNLAALAHELRTPLAAIAGLADALGAQALGPLPDAYVEYGRLIRETALHAIAVVDAMGAATAATSETPAPLSKTAHDVISALGPRARQQRVRIAIEDHLGSPLCLAARPTSQILFNLLDNALKATACEGVITVSLDEDEGLARIEVRDTGGVQPPDGASSGGIGLPVVRALCAAHGGELQFETSPKGAVVRVWLAPAAP